MRRNPSIERTVACFVIFGFAIAGLAQDPAPDPDALTNRDVVRLVAAGLSEANIIRTIHAVGLNDFDLSDEGIYELREAGVSHQVIAAMLEQARAEAREADAAAGPDQTEMAPEAEPLTLYKVELKGPEKSYRLRYTQPGYGSSFFSGSMLRFEGGRAEARAPAQDAVLEMTLPVDMNPKAFVALARLKDKSNERSIGDSAYNTFGIDPDRVVAVQLKRIRQSYDLVLYRVIPDRPFEPGEYLLILSGSYYDFGLD